MGFRLTGLVKIVSQVLVQNFKVQEGRLQICQ